MTMDSYLYIFDLDTDLGCSTLSNLPDAIAKSP